MRISDWSSDVCSSDLKEAGELSEAPAPASLAEEAPNPRIVLVGYGRVGSLVGAELKARGRRFTVIEERGDLADAARNDGAEVIVGNAVDDKVLQSARLSTAAKLLVAIPEGYDAGPNVQKTRARHPDPTIAFRQATSSARGG